MSGQGEPARFDIVGVGQCCLDTLIRVPSYPAVDAKREFTELRTEGGGPTGTALVALARWGLRTAVTGIVGTDPEGVEIESSLRAEGVNTRDLLCIEGSCSQRAFIVVESGSGKRTVFWRRPTGAKLEPEHVSRDRVQAAGVLYSDGLFAEAALAAARFARDAGVPVVVDAGSLRKGMIELARRSTCFIAAETFARELVGADDPEGACRKLAELGPRVTGVTLGSRGYIALESGKIIRGETYPAEVVDTTGCGDVFHAGFTFGLVRGWDTRRSLDFGAWAAARTSEVLGGRAGIPDPGDYPG